MQFAKYKDDGILDKASFMKEMKALILKCSPDLTENQRMKMDGMLISLYSLCDIDKNGILKADEVAAALCVLCKGSVASKIKYGMQIFSSTDTDTEVKIKLSEFTEFLSFIFKLSLERGNEIMLDYDLEKLAREVATACWKFNGIEDLERGEAHLNQVMNFMNKQSTLDI